MEQIKSFWKKAPKWYFILSVLMLYVLSSVLLGAEVLMLPFLLDHLGIMLAISYAPVSFVLGYCGTFDCKGVRKPESMLGIYAPHSFMLFWTLLLYFFVPDFGGITLYISLKEILEFLNLWHVLILEEGLPAVLIVHLTGFFWFWLGERSRAKLEGTSRKKPSLRCLGGLTAFAAVFILAGSGTRYYRVMTTVDTDSIDKWAYIDRQMANGGYGFPYENGWSSISLSPYYVERTDHILAELDVPAVFTIAEEADMPVLDGAEAAYPVYSAFANACYEGIAGIQQIAKEEDNPERPIRFTNTIEAYKSLIAGDVDIFFGAKPSAEQLALAEEAGVELELTPIGREAFVFFVSEENPVDGLTSAQIRDIYSGRITNWMLVGGDFVPILAFQRPENSGSQTMMQYFMGDTPLKEPVEVEFEASMVGIIRGVADYQNKASSIGYSFRYYASLMTEEVRSGIKFLALDGVYPDAETIRDGSYPMTTSLYAITVKGNPKETVAPFVEWMTGEQGQEIVEKTGYIRVE